MKIKFRTLFLTCILMQFSIDDAAVAQQTTIKPIRIAVAGITHGHVGWILGRKNKGDIELVGVYERKQDVVDKYTKQYKLSSELFYSDLAKMLDAVKPEAVVAFGSIYDHLQVVEACAPRHIHVMVEKPLAVSKEHADKMQRLASQYGIYLLTNYETSWYPTTVKSFQLMNDSNAIGKLKKAVFHHGHEGPKEIGVQKEFFEWLTDPIQNGGGALIDFGCYGANLMTYLTRGEQPISVTAVTKQFKPSIYPRVDDEATIVVEYTSAQAIIQASWNWPFGRKDMELYGDSGYILAKNNKDYAIRLHGQAEERKVVTEQDVPVYTDPFAYFSDVIRGRIKIDQYGVYSLENNLLVVKILDAARQSAKEGKTIYFK